MIETYERLLVRLHEQFVLDNPDGKEADRIREEMDDPWSRLTDEERDLLNHASGNLYLLHGTWRSVKGEVNEGDLARATDPLEKLRLLCRIDFNHPLWESWDRRRLARELAQVYEAIGLKLVAKEFASFRSVPQYERLVRARVRRKLAGDVKKSCTPAGGGVFLRRKPV